MAVTASDIATALGRDEPAEESPELAQWSMWIADAAMLIGAEAKRRGVEVDTLDEVTVDYVTREAVVAQVRRPDDATSVEIAVDDGREARRYSTSRGRVTILAEWWELLFPSAISNGKAFAIDSVPEGTAHAPWCSLNFGATYCSCGADIAGVPIFGEPA